MVGSPVQVEAGASDLMAADIAEASDWKSLFTKLPIFMSRILQGRKYACICG